MTGILLSLAIVSSSLQSPPVRHLEPRQIVFDLPYGSIRVYLPRHLRAGEHISGSVFASPTGSDWNAQHQNLTFLNSLSVRIGDVRLAVSETVFQMDAPAGNQIDDDLEDAAGRTYAQDHIDLSSGAALETPPGTVVAQAGNPIGVSGGFDGNRNRTHAQIDSLETGILAESEDECYVTAPADRQGPIHLRVEEAGKTLNFRINIVQLTFMAPSKPTLAGKRSSIGVEVSGLQNMPAALFPLVVELKTDNVKAMRFEGQTGDRYRMEIFPEDVVNGNVLKSVPIKALSSGSYHVNGSIDSEGR